MNSHDSELNKEVKELAERAARLYVKRRAVPNGQPEATPFPDVSAEEATLLNAAGLDVSDAILRGDADPTSESTTQYMTILNSSLTVRETSDLLGLSPSRIRQKIRERSLAAIREKRRYLVPGFQFVGGV